MSAVPRKTYEEILRDHEAGGERTQRRDWLGHGIQLLVIIVPLTIGAFAYWESVQSELAVQRTQIQTIQNDQSAMRRDIEASDHRRAVFEDKMSDRTEAADRQLTAIATDLALLRKELRH